VEQAEPQKLAPPALAPAPPFFAEHSQTEPYYFSILVKKL